MEPPARLSKAGHQQNWTKEEVLVGLQYFYQINSRYPTAREIDNFQYLPSSRSIQRQFGGLVVLRKELIPESHSDFTRGTYRSSIAAETWQRAAQYEEEFYDFLCQNFDPVAIHEHKVMRPGNVSSDYFIYLTPDKGIVLDLFYAKDLYSLRGVVTIKQKRYSSLPYKVIFILVGNNDIEIQEIRDMLNRRKSPLPKHILVETEYNFKRQAVFQIKKLSQYSK